MSKFTVQYENFNLSNLQLFLKTNSNFYLIHPKWEIWLVNMTLFSNHIFTFNSILTLRNSTPENIIAFLCGFNTYIQSTLFTMFNRIVIYYEMKGNKKQINRKLKTISSSYSVKKDFPFHRIK